MNASLLLALIFARAIFAATDPWPMFHGGASHPGRSSSSGPRTPSLRWSTSLGTPCRQAGGVESSPVVTSSGLIIVGCRDGALRAVCLTNGSLAWTAPGAGGEISSPALGGDRVFIGQLAGSVAAFAVATGLPLWRTPLPGPVWSSPTVGSDGGVFVGVEGADSGTFLGAVVRLSEVTGAVVWTLPTQAGVRASPAVWSGRVFVGDYSGWMYGVDGATGLPVWPAVQAAGDALRSSPAISADGSTLFVGSYDENIYALSTSSGAPLWQHKSGNWVESSPALAANGDPIIGGWDTHVLRLVAATGKTRWSVDVGAPVWSSPALSLGGGAGSIAFIGSQSVTGGANGTLWALDADSGALLWKWEADGSVESSPALTGDGGVVVGTWTGKLVCLG